MRCSEPQYSACYSTKDNTKFRILEVGYKHSSHCLNKINLTRNTDKPPVHTAPENDRRSALYQTHSPTLQMKTVCPSAMSLPIYQSQTTAVLVLIAVGKS
jgi:hypothetical protein